MIPPLVTEVTEVTGSPLHSSYARVLCESGEVRKRSRREEPQ